MIRSAFLLTFTLSLALLASCQKQVSDTDAIRSGIHDHLVSLKTLNLDAMDMNVTNVSIQGNQAQAQVEFHPKTGAPQGAGMQVAYSLQKQNGQWVVQTSQPSAGTIQHPAPGENQNPHMNASAPAAGSIPNFRDLIPGGGAGNSKALPPGHPPVQ